MFHRKDVVNKSWKG